ITTVGAFMLHKHLGALKENAQLKDLAARNAIDASKSALETKFEGLRQEFVALKERGNAHLAEQKTVQADLSLKQERRMGVMETASDQTDARIKLVEEKQQRTSFLVERITKKGS